MDTNLLTFQECADAGDDLDAAGVTVNTPVDEEAIFFGEGDVEEGEETEGRKKDDSSRGGRP